MTAPQSAAAPEIPQVEWIGCVFAEDTWRITGRLGNSEYQQLVSGISMRAFVAGEDEYLLSVMRRMEYTLRGGKVAPSAWPTRGTWC